MEATKCAVLMINAIVQEVDYSVAQIVCKVVNNEPVVWRLFTPRNAILNGDVLELVFVDFDKYEYDEEDYYEYYYYDQDYPRYKHDSNYYGYKKEFYGYKNNVQGVIDIFVL